MLSSCCPQLSSLSSVFDSYSDAIPDSWNFSSSRLPRSSSRDESEMPWDGVSGLSSCWGGPGRKRKHSNLIKHWSLPIGLPSGRDSCVPSLSGGRMASSGLGVVGSHRTGGTLARKVISRRLSWDPTVKRKEEIENLL